ncbi:HNH endonuclease [Priestia megaterium]|uniref:HNH endonuclease n=1 Tax=Priestia megaterium TaxID=1404 RepID=UPI0015D497F2|nr:HNH endonuclease [Priestia megaterium]
MNQIDTNRVAVFLSEKFGINLNISFNSEKIDIRLSDFEFGEGFTLSVKFEWRHLSVEFIPDNFSGALIRTMGLANISKKEIFKVLITEYSSSYNNITMKINDEIVNPQEPQYWDDDWRKLYIKLFKTPIILDELTNIEFEDVIIESSGDLLRLVLSLLPLEETEIEENIEGLPEGALTRIEVNRYERSALNRQTCLIIHGCICKACGFNFEEKYGALGKGFIHVHHIVPVSQLGSDYEINPEKDLVPLCPNCHAMIHKQNPPYSVEELKLIILSNMKVEKGL